MYQFPNAENCSLDDDKIQVLSRANWPELKCIILSHNMIAESGGIFLALSQWPKLEELHLGIICL